MYNQLIACYFLRDTSKEHGTLKRPGYHLNEYAITKLAKPQHHANNEVLCSFVACMVLHANNLFVNVMRACVLCSIEKRKEKCVNFCRHYTRHKYFPWLC